MLRIYFLSTGSTGWILVRKKRCVSPARCAALWALPWAGDWCRTVSSLLKFRHLLEWHQPGERLFQAVGEYLQDRGLRIASGTIVDAGIVSSHCFFTGLSPSKAVLVTLDHRY